MPSRGPSYSDGIQMMQMLHYNLHLHQIRNLIHIVCILYTHIHLCLLFVGLTQKLLLCNYLNQYQMKLFSQHY